MDYIEECVVCRGTAFYEDEQGATCCSYCGTQSQQFLQESNDAEDDAGLLSTFGRNFIHRKSISKQPASKPVDSGTPSLKAYISLYQQSLLYLFSSIAGVASIGKDNIFQYSCTLKSIWFKYLARWSSART